jgi:hypothetical protein
VCLIAIVPNKTITAASLTVESFCAPIPCEFLNQRPNVPLVSFLISTVPFCLAMTYFLLTEQVQFLRPLLIAPLL